MKRYFNRSSLYFCTILVPVLIGQPCHANDKHSDDTVVDGGSVSTIDPAEEARKIRQLVKLALHPDAAPATRTALADEIKFVEKNKKLKVNVVTCLINNEEPDPSLPKIDVVHYKDGTVRGLLFIQSDAAHSKTPAKLAWPIDSKREQKEMSR